jgi:hypothetical protein
MAVAGAIDVSAVAVAVASVFPVADLFPWPDLLAETVAVADLFAEAAAMAAVTAEAAAAGFGRNRHGQCDSRSKCNTRHFHRGNSFKMNWYSSPIFGRQIRIPIETERQNIWVLRVKHADRRDVKFIL